MHAGRGPGKTTDIVKRNKLLATRLLTEASDAGFVPANVKLGGMLFGAESTEGYAIDPDPEKGFNLLFEAAVQGSPAAHSVLARAAQSLDNEESANCFRTICSGETPSGTLYGYLGILLLNRAAELGDQRARLQLKKASYGTTMHQAMQDSPPLAADQALVRAITSADIEEICEALEEHCEIASADLLAEARLVRDRLKKKARKKATKGSSCRGICATERRMRMMRTRTRTISIQTAGNLLLERPGNRAGWLVAVNHGPRTTHPGRKRRRRRHIGLRRAGR